MVTIVMTTYNPTTETPRFKYAADCIDALHRRLWAPEPIEFHLADDGSPAIGPVYSLVRALRELGHPARYTSCEHNGVGASLNKALGTIEGPWMYTTDDWYLTEPLDLTLPLWLITPEGGNYDIVRLGPIHPNLMCWTKFTYPHGWWLDITQNGNGFIFATRPFLASPRFVERFGPFDEGLNAYETERLFAEKFNRLGGRAAAINIAGPWAHIGDYEVGDRDPQLFQMEKVES